ncbi:MAG TPA: hypothetical protein VHM19_17275 [Polyangiales bacterium]|jgi:hypothetical protein|nr:hypothetical protein [Polyangiales bacterium]
MTRGSMIAVALLLATTNTVHAQEPAPSKRASIWYRTTAGCPEGEAFLRVLEARQVQGRLAAVGERIDFVVTLGVDREGRKSGVLERQTAQGAVALRKVEDASCEQVADALALTLALSIDPAWVEPEPAPAAAEPPAPKEDVAPVSDAKPAPPPPSPAPATLPPPPTAAEPPPRTAQVSLGAQGFGTSGTVSGLLPGAALFAELELDGSSSLQPALRLALSGAFATSRFGASDVQLRVLSARAQACPLWVGGRVLRARPCAALDVGQIRSSGSGRAGRVDSGLFLAADAGARLTWQAFRELAFEAELGAAIPITRYELSGGGVQRAAAVGVRAALGAAVHFP